jgi:hypothetical protein
VRSADIERCCARNSLAPMPASRSASYCQRWWLPALKTSTFSSGTISWDEASDAALRATASNATPGRRRTVTVARGIDSRSRSRNGARGGRLASTVADCTPASPAIASSACARDALSSRNIFVSASSIRPGATSECSLPSSSPPSKIALRAAAAWLRSTRMPLPCSSGTNCTPAWLSSRLATRISSPFWGSNTTT